MVYAGTDIRRSDKESTRRISRNDPDMLMSITLNINAVQDSVVVISLFYEGMVQSYHVVFC